jgi:eukaryotic-like serine/threonine-protein kinase
MSVAVPETQRPSRPEQIGRYRIVERIGRGAMGVVYAAHDDLMGRDVAVKVMMTDLEAEPDIRARFMREAQVSATLAHRNIVTIFDIGEDNGRLFIVMELLRGNTLDKVLKQRTLTIEEKIDLVLEVCEGLTVASAAGVCHRDVKPANLFLQDDGSVKILDFGIARLASSSMTASGFIVGTPDYMSPEQARGTAIDERSDIFSTGAVLYLLLTGRKPFVAPDLPAVLHKVVSEDPPSIEPAAAPGALARIVFKALAKDPADRFQTFAEVSADLGRWRRRYEVETRTLADEAARRFGLLSGLAADERSAAEKLGVESAADLERWVSELRTAHPHIIASGASSADSLRHGRWHRVDIEDITARIDAIATASEARLTALRAACIDLEKATALLEAGNPRAALAGFEKVLQHAPTAAITPLVDRAGQLAAEQQAREDRVRSLLTEATEARANGRLQAALALVEEAVVVQPDNVEARHYLTRVQQEFAAAEAEKARRCERYLARARRALQLEQFDEAERQLQAAIETGAPNADITMITAALSDARSARDSADALVQEIARELAQARAEFQSGDRSGALARLTGLETRYPTSAAVTSELTRLRAEDERLGSAERASVDADRLAEEAAQALASNDFASATRLAEQALDLLPSHEAALRTAAVANAHLREIAERAERERRAVVSIEEAKRLLAQGQFDQALKEARRATELDPGGTVAPGLIAEAFRRRAAAQAADAATREATRRAAEVRELLATATTALRAKEFAQARTHAEKALALDPDNREPKQLIANIAAAAAVAATTLEEETVDLQKGEVDPEATAVLAPVTIPEQSKQSASGGIWDGLVRAASSLLSRR